MLTDRSKMGPEELKVFDEMILEQERLRIFLNARNEMNKELAKSRTRLYHLRNKRTKTRLGELKNVN